MAVVLAASAAVARLAAFFLLQPSSCAALTLCPETTSSTVAAR